MILTLLPANPPKKVRQIQSTRLSLPCLNSKYEETDVRIVWRMTGTRTKPFLRIDDDHHMGITDNGCSLLKQTNSKSVYED